MATCTKAKIEKCRKEGKVCDRVTGRCRKAKGVAKKAKKASPKRATPKRATPKRRTPVVPTSLAEGAVLGVVGTDTRMSLVHSGRSRALGAGMDTLVQETKKRARKAVGGKTQAKKKTKHSPKKRASPKKRTVYKYRPGSTTHYTNGGLAVNWGSHGLPTYRVTHSKSKCGAPCKAGLVRRRTKPCTCYNPARGMAAGMSAGMSPMSARRRVALSPGMPMSF